MHWCKFCLVNHTSASCYHPGNPANQIPLQKFLGEYQGTFPLPKAKYTREYIEALDVVDATKWRMLHEIAEEPATELQPTTGNGDSAK